MMRQFWISLFGAMFGVIFAILGLALLAVMAVSGWLASLAQSQAPERGLSQSAIVLEVDLRTPRLDQPANTLLPASGPVSLIELVTALDHAASDAGVAAVYVRAGEAVTPADAEEVRAALRRLRAAGKPVIAHIQSFSTGDASPVQAVSAASEIWMHPSGWFAATGLRAEQVFLGDALARLGAQAQFLQLYEYKGAAEVFTRSGYSDAAREAAQAWMDSLYDTAVGAIAQDRGLALDQTSSLLNAGPYLAGQALEVGLVDQLGQAEAARGRALAAAPGAQLQSIDIYARAQRQARDGAVIALIEGQGPVVDGVGPRGLGASAAIASDTLAAAIDVAAADGDVRAILLRLDTGGGSATASDQIAAAILRARRSGTPVIVSMGSVAASGGYYISAPADHIVANAGSLTGSIGVISGKIAFGSALERAGITVDSITAGGAFTGALSPADGFTDAQSAAIERYAQATYADFTARVAEGRGLPLARVEALARGRVWTGAQAAELGLVDENGGFLDALDAARRLGRISADEPIEIRRFPASPRGWARLQALFSAGVDAAESISTLTALLNRPEIQAVLRASEAQEEPVAMDAQTLD